MGSRKLELIREEKLHKLLPGKNPRSRLEASGVYAINESTCYVIFDNLNEVALIDTSLKSKSQNRIIPVLNVGTGFEDITYDPHKEIFYLIIEALKDANGDFHGLAGEYKRDLTFCSCRLLDVAFAKKNKGFEGVEHLWRDGNEYLVGLWEDALNQDDQRQGTGLLHLFLKADDGAWTKEFAIELPSTAQFKDYAAIAKRGNQVTVLSQSSRRIWIGKLNEAADGFAADAGIVYRFPSKHYANVEGVSWLSDNELVMVSDRRKNDHNKKDQSKGDASKDQSIHIFRIPADHA
ncbi:hypothetical protein [Cyanobium sp. NIES-981]|uniref:hypothetical protein n=1 Tax=Cyanobium sp. NIES-981 TaxID=1851505 RepID=UPI0007DE28DB|nr:hypothetical protein [Cyanobium sp. NIES-981]SBO43948.1 conserved protein of unknown function [Cyanobium sp. NIES-981]